MDSRKQIDLSPLEQIRWVETVVDRAVSIRVRPSDVLVVSGYWRSGTTWLQQSLAEILRAKTVFEPLHPAATRALYRDLLMGKDDAFRENFMPWGAEGPLRNELERFLGRALWSKLPTLAIRVLRSSWRDSFSTRIVAKVVRAHLCLPLLRDAFHTPIIHVVRDVRAVVASIGMTNWAWQFESLSLREQLLEVDDGRSAYFERWREQILRYDREDTVAKIVAYWALLERFVEESFPGDHRAGIRFVPYNELVRSPESFVAELLEDLGFGRIPASRLGVLARDSVTTSKERRGGLSVEERLTGWTTKLEPAEVSRIEHIVEDFGMADRLATR